MHVHVVRSLVKLRFLGYKQQNKTFILSLDFIGYGHLERHIEYLSQRQRKQSVKLPTITYIFDMVQCCVHIYYHIHLPLFWS